MTQKEFQKLAITKTLDALHQLRLYLVKNCGMSKEEAKTATKYFYKNYKKGFVEGYTTAKNERESDKQQVNV